MEKITNTNKGTALLNSFSTEYGRYYVARGTKENSSFYKEGEELTVVASFLIKEDAISWAKCECIYKKFTKYVIFNHEGEEIEII